MKLHRKTIIRLGHSTKHRTTFGLNHGRRARLSNHLPVILCALRRYIRLRRRLMKLAPELYDHGIQMNLQKEFEENERRRRETEPILRKVYGSAETISSSTQEPPSQEDPFKHLSPRKRERIEDLSQEKALWMSIALDGLHKFEKQKHLPLFKLSVLGSLLKVGSTLGRIATGLETNLKVDPHAHFHRRDFNADLERIYGDDSNSECNIRIDPQMGSETS